MNQTPNSPSLDFTSAIGLLSKSHKVLLTTHERTDGDDLGSVLALSLVLERMGKKTEIKIKGGVPPSLSFLPQSQKVQDAEYRGEPFDLAVISGCSTLDRTGMRSLHPRTLPILNIDHHPDNTRFGDISLVDPSAAAVAEVVYELISSWGVNIDYEVAQCLLTGIIADTGSFVHSNTSVKTLQIAGALFNKGARPGHITKHTFGHKNSLGLKAWAKALANTQVDYKKQMSYSLITNQDLAELGYPPITVFEGFVETINKIPEANFALFLKQDGPIVKGSLRSDPHKRGGGVDVNQLAKKYGGGGHKYAAGFSVRGTLIRAPEGGWKILPASNAN